MIRSRHWRSIAWRGRRHRNSRKSCVQLQQKVQMVDRSDERDFRPRLAEGLKRPTAGGRGERTFR